MNGRCGRRGKGGPRERMFRPRRRDPRAAAGRSIVAGVEEEGEEETVVW